MPRYYLNHEERYPVWDLSPATEDDDYHVVHLSEAEYRDYCAAEKAYETWQTRLEKLHERLKKSDR